MVIDFYYAGVDYYANIENLVVVSPYSGAAINAPSADDYYGYIDIINYTLYNAATDEEIPEEDITVELDAELQRAVLEILSEEPEEY